MIDFHEAAMADKIHEVHAHEVSRENAEMAGMQRKMAALMVVNAFQRRTRTR